MTDEQLMFEAATAARRLENDLHRLWDDKLPLTQAHAAELCVLARTVNCAVTELGNRAHGAPPPPSTRD